MNKPPGDEAESFFDPARELGASLKSLTVCSA
jgi:hypothetical protein